MTQPQARQMQRLGQHPEFSLFLASLENIPEEKQEEAWLKMYENLLPEKRCQNELLIPKD